ncbi:hypothetical protein [Duganella alba]|uniref:hypothetical protein n=1 Tax=Duganella alba TaxID=2666081 RepID=UPI001AA086BF|nr:hypothetical protein [Duganella alba]
MRTQFDRRTAGRFAAALGVLTLTVVLCDGYGREGGTALPPADGSCNVVQAQIRYDSGRTLRYCSVSAMFTQLVALEQPGLVRAALVLGADGRWLDARHAVYPYRTGQLSYRQLLDACARATCA